MWRSPLSTGRRYFARRRRYTRRSRTARPRRRGQRLSGECGLLEPVLIEILGPVSGAGQGRSVERRFAGNHQQRLQDGGISAAAGEERLADALEDVGAVAQERTRFPKVAAAEIFEYDRQIVGQLARRQLVAGPLVEAFEIDHGLSAIARLSVQVLEEMERSRTAAIEEVDIALLGLQEIAGSEIFGQREQAFAFARRDERRGADCIGNFRQCSSYLFPRVRQQRTERP